MQSILNTDTLSIPARRIDRRKPEPLSGLTILDVGCGGGLLAEVLNPQHPVSDPNPATWESLHSTL